MKIILVTAIFLQLLTVEKAQAQNELKDKLRELERGDYTLADVSRLDHKGRGSLIKTEDATNQVGSILDSLIAFVRAKKQQQGATFEKDIEPHLNKVLSPQILLPLDFNDGEELVYESFLKAISWEKAVEKILLYENFILKNGKDPTDFKSFLMLLVYLKEVCDYVSESAVDNPIRFQVKETLLGYNSVEWMVFLQQPDAMLLWLTAVNAWNFDPQKCTEKL